MTPLISRIKASVTVRWNQFQASWRTWWHTRIDRRPFQYTDRSGISIRVHPGDDLKSLFYYRSHFDDLGLVAAVKPLLGSGAIVVDVGANIGQFSLFAATQIGPTGRVFAFEPATAVWARFQENLDFNAAIAGRIVGNRLALADELGIASFYHYPENPAWNSLHPHNKWLSLDDRARNAPTIAPGVVEQVPMTTLDRFADESEINSIDVLKIDVEGFELAVLRGTAGLLAERRVKHIAFEICPDLTIAVGHGPATVVSYLEEAGYRTSKVEADGRLTPVSLEFDYPFVANYLAAPIA